MKWSALRKRFLRLQPKTTPRGVQRSDEGWEMSRFRKWVAWRLVRLARLIYPQSDAVTEFYMQQMIDYAITGQVVTWVDPMKLYTDGAA